MTAPTEVNIGTLIERRPGVNGGRPCLKGTGFSVHQVAVHFNNGLTPEQIRDRCLPGEDVTKVYAGVAFYLANRMAVDSELAAEQELYEQLAQRAAQ